MIDEPRGPRYVGEWSWALTVLRLYLRTSSTSSCWSCGNLAEVELRLSSGQLKSPARICKFRRASRWSNVSKVVHSSPLERIEIDLVLLTASGCWYKLIRSTELEASLHWTCMSLPGMTIEYATLCHGKCKYLRQSKGGHNVHGSGLVQGHFASRSSHWCARSVHHSIWHLGCKPGQCLCRQTPCIPGEHRCPASWGIVCWRRGCLKGPKAGADAVPPSAGRVRKRPR